MKKLLIIALAFAAVNLYSTRAADADSGKKKKAGLTEEQKQLRKDLLAKYDTNKDGKLDKEERKKVSADDKEKLDKAFPRRGKKRAAQ